MESGPNDTGRLRTYRHHRLSIARGGAAELRTNAPLQVGAPELVFSTYFGGTGESRGIAIAVDRRGFVYIAGRTQSKSFPTQQAAQERYGGGGTMRSSRSPR